MFRCRPVANRRTAFDRKRYRKSVGSRRQRGAMKWKAISRATEITTVAVMRDACRSREKVGSLASSQSRKRSLNVMAPPPLRTPAAFPG
uniref:Uncharacterized protein n=1 Tax=Rhizobium meliloti TaxID=382 RepID=I2E2D8_RHIML|nr:hypothetical protein pHRC017_0685 [Sinorhizobium meliloti]